MDVAGSVVPDCRWPTTAATFLSHRRRARATAWPGSPPSSPASSFQCSLRPPISRPLALRSSRAMRTPFSSSLPRLAMGPDTGPAWAMRTTRGASAAPGAAAVPGAAAAAEAPAACPLAGPLPGSAQARPPLPSMAHSRAGPAHGKWRIEACMATPGKNGQSVKRRLGQRNPLRRGQSGAARPVKDWRSESAPGRGRSRHGPGCPAWRPGPCSAHPKG